jgi:hypothetical protein
MFVLLCSDLTYGANEDGGGYLVGFEGSLALFVYSAILPYLMLTPLRRVLLEKLAGSQLVSNSPRFMEPEGSLPHSHVPATCPYPEPARSSPALNTFF